MAEEEVEEGRWYVHIEYQWQRDRNGGWMKKSRKVSEKDGSGDETLKK